MKIEIEIPDGVAAELQYLIELHRDSGSANAHENIESLLVYLATAIADGSRRPGAWERTVLNMMGLTADADEHHVYRAKYGRPEA